MDMLLKAALVGTAKHPKLPLDPAHDVDALLTRIQAAHQEHELLLRAGGWSLYQQCGQVARTDVPRLDPAPEAESTGMNRRWVDVIRQTMVSDDKELLLEFIRALQETRNDFPHELLPTALGFNDQEVREALLPVLGERGRWLSRLNPSWSWVSSGVAALTAQDRTALQRAWDEGTIGQRRLALSVLRQGDPEEGRRWLEQVLPQEKADRRAELVEQLRFGISLQDEPLLERLLDDRSEQVRLQAAQLLRRLTDSAFAARMRARGEAMLQPSTKAKTFKLKCTPPEEIDKHWIRDGIPAKAPHGRGKRGFWAELVLSSIPPSHWVNHFQKPSGELIAAIQDDDFAGDVIMAWTRALCGFGQQSPTEAVWAEPLWDLAVQQLRKGKTRSNHEEVNRLDSLLHVMPASLAEQKVEPFLRGDTTLTGALDALLTALPRPWSLAFSQVFLHEARNVVKTAAIDAAYEWVKSLDTAARALPRGSFAAALVPWDARRSGQKSWTASALAQAVDRFTDLVRVRQSFYQELHKP
jgi:hypothetical protein